MGKRKRLVKRMGTKSRLRDLCRISLFTVLICISSWIYIPFAIPFTLQTFAVFSCLFCLGGKKGTLSVLVYLLMGALGLPVFSHFSGGIGALLGSGGGFLFGFLISALIYTLLEKTSVHRLTIAFISMLFCYISGVLWFFAVYSESKGISGLMSAFLVCVLPFIIPDVIKILLAMYISKRLKKHI